MTAHLKIDFVSDVSCPWCVIGLRSLEQALERVGDETTADIHFQPFELNPQMPAEGQDIVEHIAQKYGSTPEQFVRNQEGIRARGAALGFAFNLDIQHVRRASAAALGGARWSPTRIEAGAVHCVLH